MVMTFIYHKSHYHLLGCEKLKMSLLYKIPRRYMLRGRFNNEVSALAPGTPFDSSALHSSVYVHYLVTRALAGDIEGKG